MNEDELMVTDLVEEDDAMLPDGWSEGDDFFKVDSWSGGTSQADESVGGADDAATGEDSDTQTEEDGLTMTDEDSTEEQDRSADAETDEGLSGQTDSVGKAPRIVKLKVNHEDRDVDIDSMSDDDLRAWGQKAAAYDRYLEKQAKAKYIAAFQDEIRNGMTEAHAHMVASHVTGKSFELTDDEKNDSSFAVELEDIYAKPQTPKAAEPAPAAVDERDLAAEIAQLRDVYPEFTEMPDEVAKAVANGANLLMAYVAYRGKQSEKAAASLKKENAVLKQNAAAAAKAPVKGVTGGGAAPKPKSDLLAGFDSDDW